MAAPAGVGVMGGWPGASSVGRGNRLPGGTPALVCSLLPAVAQVRRPGSDMEAQGHRLSPSLGELQLTAVGQS